MFADEIEMLRKEMLQDYYMPVLCLPNEEETPIGKYGELHRRYLREEKPEIYYSLEFAGVINTYLRRVNDIVERFLCSIPQTEKINEARIVSEICI